jgi:hypothetical protein
MLTKQTLLAEQKLTLLARAVPPTLGEALRSGYGSYSAVSAQIPNALPRTSCTK